MKPLPPVAAAAIRSARSLLSLPVQVSARFERPGRNGRQQALGVVVHAVEQIAGMGVEAAHLPGDRLHHLRVAMPDRGHVVVEVEVALAVGGVDERAGRAHDVQGHFVEQDRGRAEALLPPPHQVCHVVRQPGAGIGLKRVEGQDLLGARLGHGLGLILGLRGRRRRAPRSLRCRGCPCSGRWEFPRARRPRR